MAQKNTRYSSSEIGTAGLRTSANIRSTVARNGRNLLPKIKTDAPITNPASTAAETIEIVPATGMCSSGTMENSIVVTSVAAKMTREISKTVEEKIANSDQP